jgi:hypothetical protein
LGRVAALLVWGLLWGLAVEGADNLLGDPFEPLDVVTLAVQVCLAIALWPLFVRLVGARAERS